jgi:hypothetical protein
MKIIHTALLALAAAAPAAASATTFVDRAAFNVGVSGVVNNDLNALPIGPVTTVFGVETIASGSNAAGGNLSSYGGAFGTALGGLSSAGGVDNFDSIVINFTAPIFAFAFDDLDLTGGNSEYANIVITLVGGAIETFSVSEVDNDFQTAAFFGYASSTALQSVSIWSSNAPGGTVGGRANLIDNLAISRVAQGAVPEPGTWAMMFAGFGMIGAAMRRRRVSATTAQLA